MTAKRSRYPAFNKNCGFALTKRRFLDYYPCSGGKDRLVGHSIRDLAKAILRMPERAWVGGPGFLPVSGRTKYRSHLSWLIHQMGFGTHEMGSALTGKVRALYEDAVQGWIADRLWHKRHANQACRFLLTITPEWRLRERDRTRNTN